jgi:hypothetical protein
MTKIRVELEETDLFNAIKKIIDHGNRVEIAKALTSIIAPHERLTSIFFKTYFGSSAPDVLPVGTMITVKPSLLSYKANVDAMKRLGLLNISGDATAIIREFRGFHESHNYYVNFMNVDDNDKSYEDTGFIGYQDVITVIEEL